MIRLSKNRIKSFQDKIYTFYTAHGRKFPWRKTTDPYKIFISEVMLQQTQTDRVIKKYLEFIATFPNLTSLVSASFSEILKVWKGLGYNRRALWLQKSAQIIVDNFNGIIPQEIHTLKTLPGIGPNTAASISVFTFNNSCVFIETNIRSVYIHEFFLNKENIHDNEILSLVKKTLDENNPRVWYWALMDYGVMLKKNFPNPSQKSIHYKKQTPFKGSNREIRGYLLDLLLKHRNLFVDQILHDKIYSKDRLKKCLEDLHKEGLIEKSQDSFFIR